MSVFAKGDGIEFDDSAPFGDVEPRPIYEQREQLYSTFDPSAEKRLPAPRRRNLNLAAVSLALLLPWLIFGLVFASVSFSVHYTSPNLMTLILALCGLVVVCCGIAAHDTVKALQAGDTARIPSWVTFIFVSSAVAWPTGFLVGSSNYERNMRPYYDVLDLNVYLNVDPSKVSGQQLMDAGRTIFVDQARVDVAKSIAFKNGDVYCVAPITLRGPNDSSALLENYDFWAVGTNCCSGTAMDFHCGEVMNPRAHAALRLMRDDQRAFFRLAVQQAEAAYQIKANHPVFLSWMQDPIAEVVAYQEEGYRVFLVGICSSFALQLFLVLSAVVAFSKMGS